MYSIHRAFFFIWDFSSIAKSIFFRLKSSNSRTLLHLLHVLGKQNNASVAYNVYFNKKKIVTYFLSFHCFVINYIVISVNKSLTPMPDQ